MAATPRHRVSRLLCVQGAQCFSSLSTYSGANGISVGGVAVMTRAAKTQVPFWPGPFTLQTLAVTAFAMGLGP